MTYTPYSSFDELDSSELDFDPEELQSKLDEISNKQLNTQAQPSSATEELETVDTSSSSSTEQIADTSGRIKGTSTKPFIKQQLEERDAWKDLPQGPEREAAKKAWNIKYYGEESPNIIDRQIGGLLRSPIINPAEGRVSGAVVPAIALGLADTAADTFNLIPGINVPKINDFESSALQATRNLSGLVLPMLLLKKAAVGKATAVHKAGVAPKGIQKLGNDRLFRWFSEAGLDIGIGAGIDYTVKQNQEDDNFTGSLKKNLPKYFNWIPSSIATNDLDSPDLKRSKNIREGVWLSFFTSTLEGLTKLGKAGRSLKRSGTKFIPENELAKVNLKQPKDEFTDVVFDENPVTDQILRSQAREQKELDNLGKYFLNEDPEPLEPKIGAHDFFDANETSVRPMDVDGIQGAAVDSVRIAKNIDSTYGRLSNMLSESTRKFNLNIDSLSSRAVVKHFADELKKLGKYGAVLASGKRVTSKDIDDAGIQLAEILNNPRMRPGEMKLLLKEFKTITDNSLGQLSKLGNKAVKKSIEKLKNEFFNMDMEKARGYLMTSEAGQVSDIAEGFRLMDGTTAISRAQDGVLDRLEYLMVETNLAKHQNGFRRSHLKSWQEAVETGDPTVMDKVSKEILNDTDQKLGSIIPETKKYINQLRGIKDERPEFLKTFMLANELTDGNIDSMYKLNKFVQNKLGVFSKAFIDGEPEISSIMVKSKLSVIFNSVLSSLGTPFKALTGNTGGIIGKPTSVFAGAIARGDLGTLRRAWHQYAGVTDSFLKGFEHMKVVYRKVSTDPVKFGYIMRDDLAIKEVAELDMLENYAEAASKNGEDGASALLTIYKENEKLAKHPWLRFGANSMTALDGFNRAMYATAEAKGRAFDAIMDSGQDLTEESLQKASDEIYKSFFDENDMIINSAVDFSTKESALNLDSNLTQGITTAIRRVPILRSVFMFPKTQANSVDIFRKWSPLDLGLKPFKIFEGDYQKFTKYNWDEYPVDELEELLASKGISFTSKNEKTIEAQFKALQAEYTGRVAIGTTTMMGAGFLAMQNRIRGNGHWDPQTQRTRRDTTKWEAKTFQGWDGKWYSYEGLGPIGDLLALSVDLVDNYDSISTSTFEKMQYKLSFILGASVVDKTFLGQMEPVSDMLSGNPAAISRFSSQLINSYFPFAGMRSDMSKLIDPAKREYNSEVGDLIRNRNAWLDKFDPDGSLPYKYNFITGKVIGRPENMFTRINNTYNPIKVHDDTSPEEEFLLEIEFDSKPYFNVSKYGVEFDIHQRAELYSKVGEQGYFKQELKKIMKIANNMTYEINGVTYKGYVDILKAARRDGVSSTVLDHKDFQYIYTRLTTALQKASNLAEDTLRGTGRFIDIDSQERAVFNIKKAGKGGDIEKAKSLSDQYKLLQQTIQSR